MVKILSDCTPDAHIGVIATGDAFISDSTRKSRIFRELDALCVDMEGAAVAHTAFLNERPFASVRCISDMADEEAPFDFFEFEKNAANCSAAIMIRALPRLAAL